MCYVCGIGGRLSDARVAVPAWFFHGARWCGGSSPSRRCGNTTPAGHADVEGAIEGVVEGPAEGAVRSDPSGAIIICGTSARPHGPRPRQPGTLRVVSGYLGSYATLGLLLVMAAGVFGLAFGANRLLRPSRPVHSSGKYETYECGLDPVGGDWAQTHVRYYLYAYLYALFAVESVFLFPWAVTFNRPGFGATVVVEMAIFVGVLALGLLYAWRKRVLRWT